MAISAHAVENSVGGSWSVVCTAGRVKENVWKTRDSISIIFPWKFTISYKVEVLKSFQKVFKQKLTNEINEYTIYRETYSKLESMSTFLITQKLNTYNTLLHYYSRLDRDLRASFCSSSHEWNDQMIVSEIDLFCFKMFFSSCKYKKEDVATWIEKFLGKLPSITRMSIRLEALKRKKPILL